MSGPCAGPDTRPVRVSVIVLSPEWRVPMRSMLITCFGGRLRARGSSQSCRGGRKAEQVSTALVWDGATTSSTGARRLTTTWSWLLPSRCGKGNDYNPCDAMGRAWSAPGSRCTRGMVGRRFLPAGKSIQNNSRTHFPPSQPCTWRCIGVTGALADNDWRAAVKGTKAGSRWPVPSRRSQIGLGRAADAPMDYQSFRGTMHPRVALRSAACLIGGAAFLATESGEVRADAGGT